MQRRRGLRVLAFREDEQQQQGLARTTTVTVPKDNGQAAVAPSTRPSPQRKKEFEKINWFKYWWPVVPIDQLDPKVPQAVDLLGINMVVWRDAQGSWHAMQDRCPHRLAPLSEGRVMGNDLMCSYHGWRFNAQGSCTSVPQLEDPKAHATAVASPRNCVKVYPTKIVHGLLWIWPEPGEAGAAAAASVPTPVTALQPLLEAEADPQGSNFYQSTAWFMRDMPIRFDTLVENVVDPSHVYFAHHGVPGISRDKLINPVMTMQGEVTAQGGYMVTREEVGGANAAPRSEYGLVPPNLMSYRYPYSESHFYCIPTKPGWSRIITCIVGKKDAQVPAPIAFMSKLVSRWPVLEHVLVRHPVLDGDLYMLHAGERALVKEGNNARAYYMPANADAAVVAWRKWLERHGGEVPTCTAEDIAKMPPLMSKEQVLNRYEQHTASCLTCQRTLKRMDLATNVSAGLAAVLGVLTLSRIAAVGTALGPGYIAAGVVSVLAAAVYTGLKKARQEFYFKPYVHALRD